MKFRKILLFVFACFFIAAESAVFASSVDPHEELYSSFGASDSTKPVYPDEFGGSYIDINTDYVVRLKKPTPEMIEDYKKRCGGSSRVVFKEAQYSLNELQAYDDFIKSEMMPDYSLIGWGVDQKLNRMVIKVEYSSYADMKQDEQLIALGYGTMECPIVLEPVGLTDTGTTIEESEEEPEKKSYDWIYLTVIGVLIIALCFVSLRKKKKA